MTAKIKGETIELRNGRMTVSYRVALIVLAYLATPFGSNTLSLVGVKQADSSKLESKVDEVKQQVEAQNTQHKLLKQQLDRCEADIKDTGKKFDDFRDKFFQKISL